MQIFDAWGLSIFVEKCSSIPHFCSSVSALGVQVNRNTHPWLLNVKNGTINILSGEFREHRQEDMITKIANVEYDPKADCPMWKKFVREIMNYKSDIIKFVQTAAGWSLSGDISEQTMFILYGTGANGKSTFLNTTEINFHLTTKQGSASGNPADSQT